MNNNDYITQILTKMDPYASGLWASLHGSTRILFDGLAGEWSNLPLDSKLVLLRALAITGLLDQILRDHLTHYWPGQPNGMPHVLEGLESAMEQYEKAGFWINLPIGAPLLPAGVPTVLFIAALARTLEEHRGAEASSRCMQQLFRLQHAINQCVDNAQSYSEKESHP